MECYHVDCGTLDETVERPSVICLRKEPNALYDVAAEALKKAKRKGLWLKTTMHVSLASLVHPESLFEPNPCHIINTGKALGAAKLTNDFELVKEPGRQIWRPRE